MQRPKWMAGTILLGLILAAPVPGAERVAPSAPDDDRGGPLVVAAASERQASDSLSGPPLGIESSGKRGVVLDPDRSIPTGDTKSLVAEAPAVTAGAVRKISGAAMAGSVRSFAVDPGGTTAVYVADQETVGRFELYRSPLDGSATPIKLSAGLPLGSGDSGVRSFEISPDGTRVVFLADANHGGGTDDVFSVPLDGSATAVQLNASAASPVTAFGISPDGASVVFFGLDTTYGSGRVELYAAAIATASSARQLSDVGAGNAGGNVAFATVAPNSARAIYAADPIVDGQFQWFSVAMDAAAPGSDVQLSAALGSATRVAVGPSSANVVYAADEGLLGVQEIYSVPIGGGTRVRLDPAMAGSGVRAIDISPDGTRVGYLADQDTAGVVEVYRAMVGVAGSGVRLNTPMAGTQLADTLNVAPDGSAVLYEADQNAAGTFELFSVPIDGGTSTTLHSLAAPEDVGYFQGRGTPIVGRRAVYPVLGTAVDLFSVPFDATESFVQLNDDLAAGDTVFDAFVPSAASRLLAYGIGPSSGTVTRSIFAVPVRRDLAPEAVNVAATTGSLGVLAYEISAGEAYAVYAQDQDTVGKPELYSRELDSDADTVINAADNCPFVVNPLQQAVLFGPTVVAESATRFGWGSSMDVRFARGPLSGLATLTSDDGGTRLDATGYTDTANPAAGAGFYYLFAPDCPGRSYQTSSGAEPGRDAAAFP